MSGCADEGTSPEPTPTPTPRYTVQFTNGENGIVDHLGEQTDFEGTVLRVIPTGEKDYKPDGWYLFPDTIHKLSTLGDITIVGDTLEVKLTQQTANKIYQARFADKFYVVNFDAAENGTVSDTVQTSSAGKVVTSLATPLGEYYIDGWYTADSIRIESEDDKDSIYLSEQGLQLNVRMSEAVNGNHYRAHFTHLVRANFKPNDPKAGTVSVPSFDGPIGAEATSVATAISEFQFVGWYDPSGAKIIETDPQAAVYVSDEGAKLHVKLSADLHGATYTAQFDPIIYKVGFVTEDAGTISDSEGAGVINTLVTSKATIKVDKVEWNNFDAWYNGDVKITETNPQAAVYVSEEGTRLNVKLSSGLNGQTYTAKYINEEGNCTPRLYVSGTGDNAMLKLTKRATRHTSIFQFGSIIAWTPAAESPLVMQFNPSNRQQPWSSTWKVGGSFPANTKANLLDGKGDPCRLVGFTQGFIKAELAHSSVPDNGKWRMASNGEHVSFGANHSQWTTLDGVRGYYIGPGAGEGLTNGEFFPAWGSRELDGSPDRVGTHADFWSNTPRGTTEAYFISIAGDGQYTYNVQSYDVHANGHTIRCIPTR
ncbi:MAG: InlB B-repeat-containing protein [Phocaeicola sp.]